jgi:hypothetical protein
LLLHEEAKANAPTTLTASAISRPRNRFRLTECLPLPTNVAAEPASRDRELQDSEPAPEPHFVRAVNPQSIDYEREIRAYGPMFWQRDCHLTLRAGLDR